MRISCPLIDGPATSAAQDACGLQELGLGGAPVDSFPLPAVQDVSEGRWQAGACRQTVSRRRGGGGRGAAAAVLIRVAIPPCPLLVPCALRLVLDPIHNAHQQQLLLSLAASAPALLLLAASARRPGCLRSTGHCPAAACRSTLSSGRWWSM